MLVAGPAAALRLRAGEDVFVYAFEIPGPLGVPGIPAEIDFDEPDILDTSPAPFGQTLGVAETTPFTLPDDPTPRERTTRSLPEFDLASLGIGDLAPFAASAEAFPIAVDLKAVTEDWDEGAVTRTTRPSVGGVSDSTVMTGGFETTGLDVTSLVMGRLADPATNFSVEVSQRDVVPTDTPSMFTPNDLFAMGRFGSSADVDAALRPSLTISEVPPQAALTLMLAGGAMLGWVGRRRT